MIDRKLARELLAYLLAAIAVPFLGLAASPHLPEEGIAPLAAAVFLAEAMIGISLSSRMDEKRIGWGDLVKEIRALCIEVRLGFMR